MTRLVASRISERSSGKMPTAPVRRPTSQLSRSSGFVDRLAPVVSREGVEGGGRLRKRLDLLLVEAGADPRHLRPGSPQTERLNQLIDPSRQTPQTYACCTT
jgi:hypothetical protein